jgi:protein-disulfide isomerase
VDVEPHARELVVPLSENDHLLGPSGALARLLEYGDYECPHCARAQPAIRALLEQLGDRLQLAFRHFPLATIHPHAVQAAEAAEAAGAQGAFWPMHELLFENQDALEREDLRAYAMELGLDPEQFDDDLARHRFLPVVRDHFRGAVRSGVTGTPTFFVNGARHRGSYQYRSLLLALTPAVGLA